MHKAVMRLSPPPLAAAWFILAVRVISAPVEPQSLVYSGNYVNGAFEDLTFVNPVVGWDMFFNAGFLGSSTTIGNVEAGHIWFGHEVFVRPPGSPSSFYTHASVAPGALNEVDYHATTVGHILAGSGYLPDNGGVFTYAGLGMAPEASVVSGAVATGFSSVDVGSFSTSQASVVGVYQSFFTGQGLAGGVPRPNVINSSWGGVDPSASSAEMSAIDGLARQNGNVVLVLAAGNGGDDPVSAPASGFNNLSVGSLGGPGFLTPSGYSSRGMVDFYNPVTQTTHQGVRAAVDISAPGERYFLAAYLGDSGSIGASPDLAGIVQANPVDDLYFVNMDGTSYAAPMVAGGIALLQDAARRDLVLNHNDNPLAFDTRVIKSVLMAGATKTEGWDNGQNAMNVTTQVLDLRAGAGALNLATAADIYFMGTRDLEGTGGLMQRNGWDAGAVQLGTAFEYRFAEEFTQAMALTVALNWFSVTGFDEALLSGMDQAFSNLDLEVWKLDGDGNFLAKVGESISTYNNTEFLRFDALQAGTYGFRVVFDSMVYDTVGVTDEFFGLAWSAVAVPEPGFAMLALLGCLPVFARRRTPLRSSVP